MAEVYTDSIRAKVNGETQDVPIRDTTKAPAIILTATGTAEVMITDASDNSKLQNLTMQGTTEQVQTTGAQLFDASKIKSYSSGGATVTNNDDGSFTISGNGNLESSFSDKYEMTHEETLKLIKKDGHLFLKNPKTVPNFVVYVIKKDGGPLYTLLSGEQSQTDVNVNDIVLNEAYLRFMFYSNTGETITPTTIKPMLYQDGDGTWEPFSGGFPSPSPDWKQDIQNSGKEVNGQYEVGVRVGGKNLIDKIHLYSGENIEKQFQPLGIWIYPIDIPDGTYTFSAQNSPYKNGGYLAIGTYTQEKYTVKGWLAHESISQKYVTVELIGNKCIFLSTNDKINESVKNKIGWIQLEYGNTATEYEPFQTPQTITLHSPRPLTKWDRLVKKDGVWNWEFNSDTEVFDGSEDEAWEVYRSEQYTGFQIIIAEMVKSGFNDGFCNLFPVQKAVSKAPGIWLGSTSPSSPGNYMYAHNVNPTYATDVSGWKTWLQSHNMTVLYPIATPEYIPLSEEEQSAMDALVMYAPTSIVSADTGDLSVELEVSYIADTGTYLTANFVPKSDYNALEARVAALETTTVNNATEQ